MKIYFCEKCGSSVPLQEVVAGRATASDGNVYCAQHMPGVADGDLKLYFCDACGVSIPLQDVITGTASTEGDRTLCQECVRRQEHPERSEERYQLHFCDACNTSIPQSHVVTGRALVRGGKTYCENCRERVTRGISPLLPVLGVLVVAAIALGGVLLLGGGRGDDGPPLATQAMLDEVRSDIGQALEKRADAGETATRSLEERLEGLRATAEKETEALRARLGELTRAAEEREALREELARVRQEIAKIPALQARLERIPGLEKEIDRLRDELAAARAAPAPERAEPAMPQPEPKPVPPADDVPDAIRALIERLGSPDSGIRFSAAVDLGKGKHPAAVPALSELLRKDEDLFVRRAAARALGEIGERDGISALVDALTDVEIYVSLQAAKSLRGITGKEFGFRETLSMSQRRQVQSRWRKWWEGEKE